MVEVKKIEHVLSRRLLTLLAGLMAGCMISQWLGCLVSYFVIEDSQTAGMVAHLLIAQMSYYLLGCAFVILSLSNILIKRGVYQLKAVRMPSLILIFSIAFSSFLLIPRMDYLRELALQDGMPIMLSPLANYYAVLNGLTFSLLVIQVVLGVLITWKLTDTQSP